MRDNKRKPCEERKSVGSSRKAEIVSGWRPGASDRLWGVLFMEDSLGQHAFLAFNLS